MGCFRCNREPEAVPVWLAAYCLPGVGVSRRRATAKARRTRRRPWPYPAHGEAVPAGKLYTTQTMLPSGEGLKKLNFVGILLNSSPVLASPFAPGGSLPILFFLPTAYCQLTTAYCSCYCHCHCHFPPRPQPRFLVRWHYSFLTPSAMRPRASRMFSSELA